MKWMQLAATALIAAVTTGTAWSQQYPNKPMRWVVPYAAGGGLIAGETVAIKAD